MRKLIEQKLLPYVSKPARYLGSELNAVHKEHETVAVKVAYAFPDVYEVGMSHLGSQILYHIMNQRPDTVAERVYAPWIDMEKLMREQDIPLFALESAAPVRDFNFVAFTLQYEMTFTNILNMLNLAKIPLCNKDRGETDPIVIAGGPCVFNPEPMAEFIDCFVIGEGEEVINEILDCYVSLNGKKSRESTLLQLAQIPGVYVPRFYDICYAADGLIKSIRPNHAGVPEQISKRVVRDYANVAYPTKPIVPYMDIVHNRMMLEVFRGCTRGCRFCQASTIYRPVREKPVPQLLKQAAELVKNTGYDEISLTSLSTADYSAVADLTRELINCYGAKGIGVSLPSLRVDAFSVDLAKEVQRVRKTGLTFAPEAGTQRLRDVINKGVTADDLRNAVSSALKAGWSSFKLYFMIGLPTETEADLDGIVELVQQLISLDRELRAQGEIKTSKVQIGVSVSSFVPKAHTPFQWEAQDRVEILKQKQTYLRQQLPRKQVKFNWHDAELSFVEGVFARGDRRLAPVLVRAWQLGCKFDGWSDYFNYELWSKAFEECKVDPHFYANRRREVAEILPWDHINSGVAKNFLIHEYRKALEGQLTHDCRTQACVGCGVCPELNVAVVLAGEQNDAEN